MRIPILLGREFDERDGDDGAAAVIINRTLAHRFFAGEDPIGQRINSAPVVGVVGDVRHNGPGRPIEPQIYTPLASGAPEATYFAVRAKAGSGRLAQLVRGELRGLDAELPLDKLKWMRQVVSDSVADSRMVSSLLTMFAIFALGLATLGIYGLVVYSVSRRTHEMGVRVALGATRNAILALVMRKAAVLAVAGVTAGFPLALAASRVMRSLLFEVNPQDAGTWAGVAALLFSVTLLASYIPARRAADIQPMEALRCE